MKMIIGGQKVDASDGKTIDSINPYTGKAVDSFPSATAADVDKAITIAVQGAKEWAKVPLHKRIDTLMKFSGIMAAHHEELVQLMVKEMGKPVLQSRIEVGNATGRISAFCEGARQLGGNSYPPSSRPANDGDFIFTVRQPLGVVVAIIPFNFPIANMMTKIIPAMLMGNSVVIKPSTLTTLCDIRVIELLLESGIPGNVAQIVTGRGGEIGDLLTADDRIAAVTMTGSTATGARIASRATANISHVMLELGGNDALVILPDADLEYAVNESAINRIRNCGQICCDTKRYVVPNALKRAYLEMLAAKVKNFKLGDPSLEATECGPMVSEQAAAETAEAVRLSVKQGGKVVFGGNRLEGSFFEPTILDVPKEADVAKNLEIFAPVWTVIGYDTVEEALEIANQSDYGLNGAVIGKDLKQLLYFAKNMEAGTIVINGSSHYMGYEVPFGGYKKSGLGREGTMECLMEMSQVKSIVLRQLY